MPVKLKLICPQIPYLNDAQESVRAFIPNIIIDETAENYFKYDVSFFDGIFTVNIESDVFGAHAASLNVSDENKIEYKKLTKRFLKTEIYYFLSTKLDIKLPYGSLTGVRPTKLFYELSECGKDPEFELKNTFSVTQNRISLIKNCVKNQAGIKNEDNNSVGFFVNIPFCPTRCKYCSFISTELFRIEKRIPDYIESLLKEIESAKNIISKSGFKVSSIYVGGGSPACIGADYLGKILAPLSKFGVEFTVEVGRPDTINDAIIEVLKDNNVTRVSVNPQTFDDSVLERIGRKHTIADFYAAYEKVKCAGFSINVDLIAGLGDDFVRSVENAAALNPDNITIHTLCLKRGAEISGNVELLGGNIAAVDAGYKLLYQNGYSPYYMYRQKNTSDNLENVGFCKTGKQCKYNVDMMEESATIIGCGAGAMTKKVSSVKDDTLISRFSSPKGFNEYVERIDDTVQRKEKFLID